MNDLPTSEQTAPETQPISTDDAPHYVWSKACDGWWLKKTGPFTVISEAMPTGTSEKLHLHEHTEQFFYVLSGNLTMELNEKIYTLKDHESITVSPGVAHRVFNHSESLVCFLVVSCPDSHGDRLDILE